MCMHRILPLGEIDPSAIHKEFWVLIHLVNQGLQILSYLINITFPVHYILANKAMNNSVA